MNFHLHPNSFLCERKIERHRCHGDRSAFCRKEALQQHCSLPSFQRLCCESCRPGNSTKTPATTSKSRSASAKPTKRKSASTTTHTPSTTLPNHHRTSTEAYSASTVGSGATFAGTPWFLTSVTMSPGTLGYTASPNRKSTTTHIQIHATGDFLSEQNTTFLIPTASPNITPPSGNDVRTNLPDANDLTVVPSTAEVFNARPRVDDGVVLWSTSTTTANGKGLSSVPVTPTANGPTTTAEPTPVQASFTASGTPLVSTTTSSTTTSLPTTSVMTTALKTSGHPNKVDETSENNAIDIPNQTIPLDHEFPQNNIIPRRGRVFLRERTRNKRIQELLEEKRNFLRRMKRAQGV